MHELIHLMVTKPNVIAISETKLNPNSVSNVNLSNYKFFRNDSPTNAGGVGLYTVLMMQLRVVYKMTYFLT